MMWRELTHIPVLCLESPTLTSVCIDSDGGPNSAVMCLTCEISCMEQYSRLVVRRRVDSIEDDGAQ